MSTTSSVPFSVLFVIVIVVAGMFILMNALNVTMPDNNTCYQALNAAGQVVETVCY